MARVAVKVDKNALKREIDKIEANGPLESISELVDAVEATDWAKNHDPKPLTAGVIRLRIKEFGLEIKTKPGKRGQSKGFGGNRGKRTSRADKFAESKPISISLELLDNKWADSNRGEPEKIREGSLRKAVNLKCLDCAGGKTGEVARCCIYDCSIWAFRPWRGKSGLEVLSAAGTLDGLSTDEAMKLVKKYDGSSSDEIPEGDAPDEDEVDTDEDE